MSKTIDWMYFRKSCTTCKRAKGFIDLHKIDVAEMTDASKIRKGRAEALALAKTADTIVVAKGKKHVVFDMKNDRPDNDTLVGHLLGPTGNLRAPTVRIGDTLYIGFNEDAWAGVGT
jgi:arsenate reductase-like glutaredoxin family protein